MMYKTSLRRRARQRQAFLLTRHPHVLAKRKLKAWLRPPMGRYRYAMPGVAAGLEILDGLVHCGYFLPAFGVLDSAGLPATRIGVLWSVFWLVLYAVYARQQALSEMNRRH